MTLVTVVRTEYVLKTFVFQLTHPIQKQYEQPVKKAIVVLKAKKSNAIIIPVASFPHHLCLVYKMAQCQLHFYTDWRFVYMYGSSIAICIEREKSQVTGNPLYGETGERGATHPESSWQNQICTHRLPNDTSIQCCTNRLTPFFHTCTLFCLAYCFAREKIYSSNSRILNFTNINVAVVTLTYSKSIEIMICKNDINHNYYIKERTNLAVVCDG